MDSTKYKDLYIAINSSTFSDTIVCSGIIWLGDKDYVPLYGGETEDYLLFGHDCAPMDCYGITLLNKKIKGRNFELYHVIFENIKEGVIAYNSGSWDIPEKDYFVFDLFETDTLQYSFEKEVYLDSVYLKDNKVHILTYDNDEDTDAAKKFEGILQLNRKK